jgi:hypothetical protein
MADRRSLVEGIQSSVPPADPKIEKQFVFGTQAAPGHESQPLSAGQPGGANQSARVPISTRMRADLATALKRASLERQLEGVGPNTLQDILEEAVEPWLRKHGYVK